MLLVALGGCSGTPLGTRLGESFGPAPTTTPVPTTPRVSTTPKVPATTPVPATNPVPATPAVPTPTPVPPTAPTAAPPPKATAAVPTVPYRVVLRLPRTDPAAPAEALTQALRAADLPFEVETIERLQAGDEGRARGR